MLSDFRLAFRALDKSRGFAAIAIITLATGIGGTTAMFSALRALVMVPFQYPSPDQLVMVWSGDYWPLSSADFKDLLEKSTSFTDFGAYAPRTANVGSGKPEAVSSVVCTSGVLRAFGVRPELGRWLEAADDAKGAAPVALISHALWEVFRRRSRFDRARSADRRKRCDRRGRSSGGLRILRPLGPHGHDRRLPAVVAPGR
jgi:hypothetical protein